jgi:hypothetical protein
MRGIHRAMKGQLKRPVRIKHVKNMLPNHRMFMNKKRMIGTPTKKKIADLILEVGR